MFVRVEEVMGRDEWQSQHGPMVGWNLRVTDENGNEDFISLNSKPNNVFNVGQEFEFSPNGQMFGAFKKGKREQPQGGGRGGYSAPRQNTPQNAQNRPQSASSPQQAPKVVPTMTQAVAVFSDCATEIAAARAKLPEGDRDLLGPGQVTTLFLARMDARVVRNPSQADIEAEAAAKAKAAEEAKAKAEAAAAEAAKQAALAAMPAQPTIDDSDIPF